jgi:hypothetical protein
MQHAPPGHHQMSRRLRSFTIRPAAELQSHRLDAGEGPGHSNAAYSGAVAENRGVNRANFPTHDRAAGQSSNIYAVDSRQGPATRSMQHQSTGRGPVRGQLGLWRGVCRLGDFIVRAGGVGEDKA